MNNYERFLLKISGESLGQDNKVLDFEKIEKLSNIIVDVWRNKKKLAIVVGGGNIFRGRNGREKTDSVNNDFMGMTATVVNALALGGEIKRLGGKVKIMSALAGYGEMEMYQAKKAKEYLEENHILVLGGGSGRPGITTDTTSAQRAKDLDCQVVLKASTVDGVYDKDPKIYPEAKKYDKLGFNEAIEKNLKIMDKEAFEICRENNIEIIVFNSIDNLNIKKIIDGETIGTVVRK